MPRRDSKGRLSATSSPYESAAIAVMIMISPDARWRATSPTSTLYPGILLQHSASTLPVCHSSLTATTMPIRNPFRRAGAPEIADENQRNAAENGFKDTTVSGAKPLAIKDPAEYKLSGEAPSLCAGRACASGVALDELALTFANRDQRQRRVPAGKNTFTLQHQTHVDARITSCAALPSRTHG
jgi:hypothetical protein